MILLGLKVGSVIASSAPSETGFRVRKILFSGALTISFFQLELSYEENFGDERGDVDHVICCNYLWRSNKHVGKPLT